MTYLVTGCAGFIGFHTAVRLLKQNKNFYKVYNCGYGKGFSVLEIVNAFEKIIKKKN